MDNWKVRLEFLSWCFTLIGLFAFEPSRIRGEQGGGGRTVFGISEGLGYETQIAAAHFKHHHRGSTRMLGSEPLDDERLNLGGRCGPRGVVAALVGCRGRCCS